MIKQPLFHPDFFSRNFFLFCLLLKQPEDSWSPSEVTLVSFECNLCGPLSPSWATCVPRSLPGLTVCFMCSMNSRFDLQSPQEENGYFFRFFWRNSTTVPYIGSKCHSKVGRKICGQNVTDFESLCHTVTNCPNLLRRNVTIWGGRTIRPLWDGMSHW